MYNTKNIFLPWCAKCLRLSCSVSFFPPTKCPCKNLLSVRVTYYPAGSLSVCLWNSTGKRVTSMFKCGMTHYTSHECLDKTTGDCFFCFFFNSSFNTPNDLQLPQAVLSSGCDIHMAASLIGRAVTAAWWKQLIGPVHVLHKWQTQLRRKWKAEGFTNGLHLRC